MTQLLKFANTLANKSIVETLPEHEAMAYIQLCRFIEKIAELHRLHVTIQIGELNGGINTESP